MGIDRVLGRAIDDFEDMMIEGDADETEELEAGAAYVIELDTVSGPMRVGFGSHIGGQIAVARMLLMFAEVPA